MKRLLLFSLVACCSGAPLPNDLVGAQAREAARDDEGALAAYRAVRADCERVGRRRPHDDCGTAAVREAEMLERLQRWREAEPAWQRAAALSADARQIARAGVRAALLRADRLDDAAGARALAWSVVERFPDEVPADDALRLAVRLAPDEARLAERLAELWQRDQALDLGDNLLWERAELARRRGEAASAVALYDQLADHYPHSGLRDDSLWRAAALLRAGGDFRGAIARLRRILDTHKDALITGSYNSILLDDAQLLVGRIWLDDLHDPAQAELAFESLADDFKDSTLRDDALAELARARLARHAPPTDADRAAACAALARLFREYPNGNMVRRARGLAAELACR